MSKRVRICTHRVGMAFRDCLVEQMARGPGEPADPRDAQIRRLRGLLDQVNDLRERWVKEGCNEPDQDCSATMLDCARELAAVLDETGDPND